MSTRSVSVCVSSAFYKWKCGGGGQFLIVLVGLFAEWVKFDKFLNVKFNNVSIVGDRTGRHKTAHAASLQQTTNELI
jgi:hypothetical protein